VILLAPPARLTAPIAGGTAHAAALKSRPPSGDRED